MFNSQAELDESSLLLEVLKTLPLFKDDVFLRMQAHNIAMVNDHILNFEQDMFQKFIENDRAPIPEMLFTSAISQMWIFSLYELLRTWRQQVREILVHREKYIGKKEPSIVVPEQLDINTNRSYLQALVRAETDDDFAALLKVTDQILEPVFRKIEGVRVTLAKHEVPKQKGVKAANVGYSRIDPLTGSINYFYLDKDGFTHIVSRQSLVLQLLSALKNN